jgi:lambda family phage portal protein
MQNLEVLKSKPLLDQFGRTMRADSFSLGAGTPTLWDASGTGRRLRSWNPGLTGPNSSLIFAADTIRARCRDTVRKNPWAISAIQKSVSNVVGGGIKPQSQAPGVYKRQIQDLWNQSYPELDAAGRLDFYGLQALAWRSTLEGGEVFARCRWRLPEDRLAVPIQLQLLEAEHMPEFYNMQLPNGNVVRAGIEFNQISQRVAYWLYREHPGDRALFLQDNLIPIRVPAMSYGTANVIHMYPLLRPGQMRGLPWLTSVLTRLYEIDQYEDAELVRKKVAALFAGFITKNSPEDNLVGEQNQSVDTNGTVDLQLEPGTLQALLPGESITFSNPKDQSNFVAFMAACLRAIAAGLGITYEQLTGDMTGVNYSSARVALLEFRRLCEQYQRQIMVFQFCQPFFNAWLDAAVISGALTLPGYAQNPRPYRNCDWHPPRWDWVSPKDDIAAERAAVEACFKSPSRVINEMGDDAELVYAEIARDQALQKALGINPVYGIQRITGTETVTENTSTKALPVELL